MNTDPLPVAVIGAGPVGLATAAHLHERGIPFVVFEVGDDIATNVRDWGHVQLFSPWRYDIDTAARRLLEASGWVAPDPDEHPTGAELIDRYLTPLGFLPEISAHLRTDRFVVGIARAGIDKVRTPGRDDRPFFVVTESPHGPERTLVRAVIDASGTWLSPNPLGADGLAARGEGFATDRIVHGIPDVLGQERRHYAGRRVAVVGRGRHPPRAPRDRRVRPRRPAAHHPDRSRRRAWDRTRRGRRCDPRRRRLLLKSRSGWPGVTSGWRMGLAALAEAAGTVYRRIATSDC